MELELRVASYAPLMVPLVIFLVVKIWQKLNPVPENLPPGPKKLPIIGNMHLVSDPPFRSFRDLSNVFGPLMHVKLGELDLVIVSSPEVAKEVLKDNDPVFTDRPQSIALKVCWYDYIDIAFCPYGEYWRQMRKICILELLSAKSVRSFAPIRKDEVSSLVQFLHQTAGAPINLTEKVATMISSITCRSAFGKICRDKEAMIRLVREGLSMGAGFTTVDFFPSNKLAGAFRWAAKMKLLRMRGKLDFILDDVIRRHETNPGGNGEFGNEDLVDVLLRIKEKGEMKFPIGNDNIKAVLLDMFAAGVETSSSTTIWAMTELLKNPRVMAKAQAEVRALVPSNGSTIEDEDIPNLKYLKLVIMETLRLHPQGSVLPRVSREACEVSGYRVPGNVRVFVNAWAIHRDPKYWEDPESFLPERFENQKSLDYTGNNDFRYLPFGSGKRMCPGMSYASASVTTALAQLLYSFNWKLPDGVNAGDLDMIETTGITTSRKQDLIVVATPRSQP